jgi:hypothetical protein
MTLFKKSQKKSIKLKVAITGASGSGKTFSSLRLASGLGKRIALIDTENGSASLYADQFEFDVLELKPPFETEKYIHAIKDAEEAGYEVLIIDSLSHAWAGEGGLLEQKEKMDSRGGNSYTNWGNITKKHEAFKSAFLQTDIHIVCTMRSKQDYIMEVNDKGKMTPKKVGLAPIQRDGMEYEFTTVFDVAMNHDAIASKDRTSLFSDKIFKITEDTGLQLKKWLNSKPQTNIDELKRIIAQLSNDYKASTDEMNMIYKKLKNECVPDEFLYDSVQDEFEKIKKKETEENNG